MFPRAKTEIRTYIRVSSQARRAVSFAVATVLRIFGVRKARPLFNAARDVGAILETGALHINSLEGRVRRGKKRKSTAKIPLIDVPARAYVVSLWQQAPTRSGSWFRSLIIRAQKGPPPWL